MTEGPGWPAGWDAHVHVFADDAPVLAGHYRPVARSLAEIEQVGAAEGVGHLVLVQPSVYGTDNRVLLDALAREPGRHRAVVVVDPAIGEGELAAMHALGVRGVRFNLVSPVGERGDVTSALSRLAPSLRALGWHVQWYVDPAQLPRLVSLQRAAGLPFVLDHLAGMHPGAADDVSAWSALDALADAGTWIKLSGWYRLQAREPYVSLDPLIDRIARRFEGRLVWGSDWPHTSFAADQAPRYASTWAPVLRVLGSAKAARLHAAAARHYA